RRGCVVAFFVNETSLGDWIASIGIWHIKKIAPSIALGAVSPEFRNARLPITNFVSRKTLRSTIEAVASPENIPSFSDDDGKGDLLKITTLAAKELASTHLKPGLVQFKRVRIC
ncbi:MAG: hypothetical protein CMF52_05830, partial [Legionellales bacterium]|nr:hypothetical protein [Legionellales bacterium]